MAQVPQPDGAGGGKANGAVFASPSAERDLSVQVSGWMLMEAAATVAAG
jgi:predicted alpha-1,6-mannanase (GH76 family)